MSSTPENWIQIARVGTFTDSYGRPQSFTESDLTAIAAAYDPKKRDAPLVFGHPATNAPAFGWVQTLKTEGGKLFAQFAQVPGIIRDLVSKGHYRHVSMSLMPDRVSLRHVGLLGAAQPAIDGLPAVELAEGPDNITIEFSKDAATDGGMPRSGSEAATALAASDGERPTGRGAELDKIVKESPVATMEELQQQVGALTEQLNALKAENAKLKSEKDGAEGEKGEAEKKAEATAAEFTAYKANVVNTAREKRVLALVNSGRLEPAEKDETLSFAAALAEVQKPVNFAAADGKTEAISAEERYFRDLEARDPSPLNVNFAAFAPAPAHARAAAPAVNLADVTSKL